MRFENAIDRGEGKVLIRLTNTWETRIKTYLNKIMYDFTGKKGFFHGHVEYPSFTVHYGITDNSYSALFYSHRSISSENLAKFKKILHKLVKNVDIYESRFGGLRMKFTTDNLCELCYNLYKGHTTPKFYYSADLAFVLNRNTKRDNDSYDIDKINSTLQRYIYYKCKPTIQTDVYLDIIDGNKVLYIVGIQDSKNLVNIMTYLQHQLADTSRLNFDLFEKEDYIYLKCDDTKAIDNFLTLLKLQGFE